MRRLTILALLVTLVTAAACTFAQEKKRRPLNVDPPHIATDSSVQYDYDIVYVRAPRLGKDKFSPFTEVVNTLQAGLRSDLVLLHPDGREEVLINAGDDSITDPFVSFDGEWVYYARIYNAKGPGRDASLHSVRSDIFKIHVKSRKIVQLTNQEFTPNTGVVSPRLPPQGVYNLGPCPLPGGKVIFTSNRTGYSPTKAYTPTVLQLFVMDDNGSNVERIGHLNINSALHPTILKDGRVMYTTFESQGFRSQRVWDVWTIHPDGTNWAPLVSNFVSTTAFHFMTQLSDETLVVEEYYNLNNQGFGTFYKLQPRSPEGEPFFGSAWQNDPRNPRYIPGSRVPFPFSPYGLELLTTFANADDVPAPLSDSSDPKSMRVGKVTHPSGAPDNHLLTAWSPGPVNFNNGIHRPIIDSGIYLLKSGKPIHEPGAMVLIKNDPRYNEQWPRALVPYERIYGVKEPARLPVLANNGQLSPHLPEGTPFGLVGSSSIYKRESYPNGFISPGKVTAAYGGGNDPFQGLGGLWPSSSNWYLQGSDSCRYENSEIHAIRIVITEPTTDPRFMGKRFNPWWNSIKERLRILGEFPVRKFQGGEQPIDPDGNPDTSFLAKIPGDVAWTFQTLDKNGMVLNAAQTWHQVRPGEVRNDCGGCHAHSQKPTLFKDTAAAKADYVPFDLTERTPLLTTKKHDESGKKWDKDESTGLRFVKGVKNVEYYRDIKPILDRSCAACHTKSWKEPAGNLVLDDDTMMRPPELLMGMIDGPAQNVPGTYFRLALDQEGRFGYKSPVRHWLLPQASRYIRFFSSRRSLLVWKIFGKRLDGWSNDDFISEAVPGDKNSLHYKGKAVSSQSADRERINLAYTGSIMPPPQAVAGAYEGPDGKKIKVQPLSDEDRLTLVRWIDFGCPINFEYSPANPKTGGRGWMQDDNRPTLSLTYPRAGVNTELTRILVGMHDYDSGVDISSFRVTANFRVDGIAAGRNLAGKFKRKSPSVWEFKLAKPLTKLAKGELVVSVADRQGNITRIERSLSVSPKR